MYDVSDMVWSYSRLSAFEQCRYQFYLKYIVSDDSLYLAEGNFYTEAGSYVHHILEMVLKGELSVDDAGQYYIDHYDENVFYKTKPSAMERSYETCAAFFGDLTLKPLHGHDILGVEQEIQTTINGHKLLGYIDLLLRDMRDNRLVIVDHKSNRCMLSRRTNQPLKSMEQQFDTYKHQMYLYCHAVNELYGEFPHKIVWHHFKDNACDVIPFRQSEYEQTLRWLDDTIAQIEHEEEFSPTVDFFYCNNLCPFRNSCEYVNMEAGYG